MPARTQKHGAASIAQVTRSTAAAPLYERQKSADVRRRTTTATSANARARARARARAHARRRRRRPWRRRRRWRRRRLGCRCAAAIIVPLVPSQPTAASRTDGNPAALVLSPPNFSQQATTNNFVLCASVSSGNVCSRGAGQQTKKSSLYCSLTTFTDCEPRIVCGFKCNQESSIAMVQGAKAVAQI